MKIHKKLLLGVGIVGVASMLFAAGAFAGSRGISMISAASAETVSTSSQMQSMANMCENLKKSDPAAYKQMLDVMKSSEVKKVLDGSEVGRKMLKAMEDENFTQMGQLMKDHKTRQEMMNLMKQPALQKLMQSMHKNGNMQKMHDTMHNGNTGSSAMTK